MNLTEFLSATFASYVLGALWFSPLLFGNIWAKLAGMDKKISNVTKSQMNTAYAGNLLTTMVSVYVLSLFLDYANANTLFSAVSVAFLAWLGFLATTQLGSVFWERKPVSLYLITTSHTLVSLVVMAVVLTLL